MLGDFDVGWEGHDDGVDDVDAQPWRFEVEVERVEGLEGIENQVGV